MFAEEVGFRFAFKGGFQNARSRAADTQRIRQSDVQGVAAVVLINRHQIGNAVAFHILAPHGMTGAFGRDHEYVYRLCGNDLFEMNVETVRERKVFAFRQVGRNGFFINIRHFFIGRKHHYDVRFFSGFRNGEHFKTRFFGDGPRSAALIESDNDLDAAVAQIERVRMPLRAVADDGDRLFLQKIQIAVAFVIYLCIIQIFSHNVLRLPLFSYYITLLRRCQILIAFFAQKNILFINYLILCIKRYILSLSHARTYNHVF